MRVQPACGRWVAVIAVLGVFLVGTLEGWPSAVWEVFVNNHKLAGYVQRRGRDVLVEAAPAVAALNGRYAFDAASRAASVNGVRLTSTRIEGRRILVSLRELAAALKARLQDHPDLGFVDVITFDPARRAQALAQRDSAAASVAPPPGGDPHQSIAPGDMEPIYRQCHRYLHAYLGMDITATVQEHFTTLEDVQSQVRHPREKAVQVYGFTRWNLTDTECELWVPYGLPRDRVTHIMCHEMSHVWQRQEDVQFGTDILIEGFAEWTSYTMMQYLGYTDEMKRIEDNKAEAYSHGYFYIKRMAGRLGAMVTIEHFRHSRTNLLRAP